MQLTFLGTGHGDPNLRRFNAATLLQSNGNNYLLDAGDAAATSLIRYGKMPSELSALFVSHLHDDHVGGILCIVKSALKYREKFPDKKLQIFLPEKRSVKPLENFLGLFFSESSLAEIPLNAYTSGDFYHDEVLKMRAIATGHLPMNDCGEARSFAWQIKAEGKTLLMTNDLASDFSDFPDTGKEQFFDGVICELTHFNLKTALPVIENLQCGKLIFTHVYDFYDSPAGLEIIDLVKKKVSFPVIIAEDGISMEF